MSIGAAWIYNRARSRLTTARLFRGLLLALLVCVLALRVGFKLTDASWPAFVLLGFTSVTNALLNVEVWGLPDSCSRCVRANDSSDSLGPES